jgi:hypothetical protein
MCPHHHARENRSRVVEASLSAFSFIQRQPWREEVKKIFRSRNRKKKKLSQIPGERRKYL